MIPKKIYFTYANDKPPALYICNLKQWASYCPEWEIHYFSDQKIFQFFKKHFPEYGEDVLKIPLGAALADVFRYAILYVQGGMYTDIDTIPLRAIPEKWLSYQTVIGYEFQPSKFPQILKDQSESKDLFCQWTLLAAPKVSLFKEALDASFSRLRKANFTFQSVESVYETTGPVSFSAIVEKHLPSDKILLLDMDYFAVYDKYLNVTDRTVVKHLFHGYEGWKCEIDCPQLRFF